MHAMTEKRFKEAEEIPIADPKKPKSKQQITLFIRKLSKGTRKDAKTLKHIKDNYMNNPTNIFQVNKLPENTDPNFFYPTSSQLLRQKAFGKNNLFKLFNAIPNFANIAVIMWKGSLLNKEQK